MKRILPVATVLCFLLFCPGVRGEESSSGLSPIYVQSFDPNVSLDGFGPGYEKHTSLTVPKPVDPLPTIQARDEALSSAGLGMDVRGWDDLDRDFLYRRARKYDVTVLKTYYPKLSSAKLARLREKVQAQDRALAREEAEGGQP